MNNLDKSDLRRVILSTADQFKEGFEVASHIQVSRDFSAITVSGMGGSALHADVLKCFIADYYVHNPEVEKVEIIQNRTYKLPTVAYKDTLNIICSHSGNTEETISSFAEAIENNLLTIGISSGGLIEEMCEKHGIQHIKLPIPFENFQPRMATGHFVAAILKVLSSAGKIDVDLMKIENEISDKIREDIIASEENGKEIAKKLVGKTPIIYAADRFRAMAMVGKIKINENSKTPAFWNYFPELNHNEFVGFTNTQADFVVLSLQDEDDHPRNHLRYKATADALKEKGIDTHVINIPEGNMMQKIFSTVGLCDWISYYLALEYGQDPTPVDMVEDFKKALA